MSEISYIFDFKCNPSFFDHLNVDFALEDMDGSTSNFNFYFCSTAPSNISECLNNDGTLKTSVLSTIGNVDCKLDWDGSFIKVATDTTLTITGIVPLKAIFIRDKTTGYVFGYTINSNSFEVSNEIVFEEDTILFSLYNGDGE